MDPRDLRAYANRPWGAAEVLKQEYWAREFAERGPDVTLAAAGALWRHMRLVHPTWPSDAERNEDFAHHLALKRTIDHASGAFIALAAR